MNKFESMLEANRITHVALEKCKETILARETITKVEVETLVKFVMTTNNVVSSFKDVYDYPYNMCVSVNDEVIHGVPKEDAKIVKGDLVSLDFGVIYNGYCADAAISFINNTVELNPISKKRKLVRKTKKALDESVRALQDSFPNCKISDIIKAIQTCGEGYGIIDSYGGHGIGENLHDKGLFIPNSFKGFTEDKELQVGDYFTIEPMFTLGSTKTITDKDGYTIKTEDGSLAAHFEYSIAITKDGVIVLK